MSKKSEMAAMYYLAKHCPELRVDIQKDDKGIYYSLEELKTRYVVGGFVKSWRFVHTVKLLFKRTVYNHSVFVDSMTLVDRPVKRRDHMVNCTEEEYVKIQEMLNDK